MVFDWSFLPSLISAASGLVGVWLGGRLTWKREALREEDRAKKDSIYLAILVVAHLDRFANGCMHASRDDGTSEGHPAGTDGLYCEVTVKAPAFDPLGLDVNWKSLPPDLMYDILNLPYRAEKLENHVAEVWEFDGPPDYTETFWTRQYGYADLGLEVSELAVRLRMHAGLPIAVPAEGDWNRDELLREQMDKITKARADYTARVTQVVRSPNGTSDQSYEEI